MNKRTVIDLTDDDDDDDDDSDVKVIEQVPRPAKKTKTRAEEPVPSSQVSSPIPVSPAAPAPAPKSTLTASSTTLKTCNINVHYGIGENGEPNYRAVAECLRGMDLVFLQEVRGKRDPKKQSQNKIKRLELQSVDFPFLERVVGVLGQRYKYCGNLPSNMQLFPALLYDSTKLKCLESGLVPLPWTQEPRAVVWGVFTALDSGIRFLAASQHNEWCVEWTKEHAERNHAQSQQSDLSKPEVSGLTARHKAQKLLLTTLHELAEKHLQEGDRNIIYGQDMNGYNPKEANMYRSHTAEAGFFDAHKGFSDKLKSRHGFDGPKKSTHGYVGRIDYIWYTERFQLLDSSVNTKQSVWTDEKTGRREKEWPSDHFPILASFQLRKPQVTLKSFFKPM